MNFNIAKSKELNMRCPYFAGVSYGKIAINRNQIRIGLYWWHICLSWQD